MLTIYRNLLLLTRYATISSKTPMAEKLPLLTHLNPFKDMKHVRELGVQGTSLVSQRNLVRGGIAGALAGAVLDHTIGNGGMEWTLYLAGCGAVTDSIQGLGRGAMQIVNGNKSN